MFLVVSSAALFLVFLLCLVEDENDEGIVPFTTSWYKSSVDILLSCADDDAADIGLYGLLLLCLVDGIISASLENETEF